MLRIEFLPKLSMDLTSKWMNSITLKIYTQLTQTVSKPLRFYHWPVIFSFLFMNKFKTLSLVHHLRLKVYWASASKFKHQQLTFLWSIVYYMENWFKLIMAFCMNEPRGAPSWNWFSGKFNSSIVPSWNFQLRVKSKGELAHCQSKLTIIIVAGSMGNGIRIGYLALSLYFPIELISPFDNAQFRSVFFSFFPIVIHT